MSIEIVTCELYVGTEELKRQGDFTSEPEDHVICADFPNQRVKEIAIPTTYSGTITRVIAVWYQVIENPNVLSAFQIIDVTPARGSNDKSHFVCVGSSIGNPPNRSLLKIKVFIQVEIN